MFYVTFTVLLRQECQRMVFRRHVFCSLNTVLE